MKIYIKLSERSFRCFNNKTARPRHYDGCLPSGNHDGKNFCYTRSHLNGSAIRGQWGYCDQNCTGTENSSIFNLASKEHNEMWSEDIFNLGKITSIDNNQIMLEIGRITLLCV